MNISKAKLNQKCENDRPSIMYLMYKKVKNNVSCYGGGITSGKTSFVTLTCNYHSFVFYPARKKVSLK